MRVEAVVVLLENRGIVSEEPGVSPGTWHVLLTKSRQEKALAEDLENLKIDCYLPLIKAVRYHRNRKVTVDIPMFTGYVFLRGSVDDAYRADRTNRVARIIRVVNQEQLDAELTGIRTVTEKNARLEV